MAEFGTQLLGGGNFEYILEGTETKARCKLCGAIMDSAAIKDHKCPETKPRE
jgi:tRNA(Ile2) C34 agmatinyltransferase TiaS